MIHVMVAEDEWMARKELLYLLEKEAGIEICPSAETGKQLVELYEKYEPDVVFLDVEMPEVSGIEAAKQISVLSHIHSPLFVLTTAYDEYALDAFEIEAVDYLLKPYDDQRFHEAMGRVRKRLKQMESNFAEKVKHDRASPKSKLLVEDGERMVVIEPESILYAVPFNRMLEIYTTEKMVTTRLNLQELEKRLTGHAFFRTHRSYLVNLNHIKEITPWINGTSTVTLNDGKGTSIPVSRAARKVLLEHFNL